MARRKESIGDPRSPVVTARGVPPLTRLLLCVRAGGRCEFDDCNEYLFEHHVTLAEGVFAEVAHIVAFRQLGPRGSEGGRPSDIHVIDNLILLCAKCHKLIDDHPESYTRQTLERFKAAHEEHIRRVTGLRPEKRTAVLVVQARIGGRTTSIPPAHVFEAVAPLYPYSKNGTVIDLTQTEEGPEAIQYACATIQRKLKWLVESPDSEIGATQHLSVFALAPMPVLVFLGSQLSDKVPTDLFQRHRDTETWTWKKQDDQAVRYQFRQLQAGRSREKAALVLSLSGVIGRERWPDAIDDQFSVYEITLDGTSPSTGFLRTRADLEGFRTVYQQALEAMTVAHGVIAELHVLPAVPAPIAVLCGRDRLSKAHPALLVYDFDQSQGGFGLKLRVN